MNKSELKKYQQDHITTIIIKSILIIYQDQDSNII